MDLIMETLIACGGKELSTVMFAQQLKQLLSDLHKNLGKIIMDMISLPTSQMASDQQL